MQTDDNHVRAAMEAAGFKHAASMLGITFHPHPSALDAWNRFAQFGTFRAVGGNFFASPERMRSRPRFD